MSVINVEEDDSKLPQSSPRTPQQGLVNEVSSVSHEHHAPEQQLARSGYVQQTTLSGVRAADNTDRAQQAARAATTRVLSVAE